MDCKILSENCMQHLHVDVLNNYNYRYTLKTYPNHLPQRVENKRFEPIAVKGDLKFLLSTILDAERLSKP